MSKPQRIHSAGETLVEVPGVGIIDAYGDTVPADASEGYATGCVYRHTDGGAGTSLYVNEGTKASCDFNAIAGSGCR